MPKINPNTLRVKGWDKWQTYRKDRGQPPWIKLHQSLRRDPDWVDLTDAQKGQLVSIWMLAADRNGVIPYDPIKIQKLLYLDHKFDLEFFVLQGFLIKGNYRRQRDASVTPTWRQHDALETEAEGEGEGADALARTEPKSAAKKGTRWNGETVPDEWRNWATLHERLTTDQVNREADKFADYWRAAPGAKGVKLDWLATWRNWIRRSAGDKPKQEQQAWR